MQAMTPTPTKAVLVPAKEAPKVQKLLEEERLKEKRMQDVLLLLQNLVEREKATIMLIIDCLYDVATINLANQKVPQRRLNGFTKWFAMKIKSVAKAGAWWWFKGNVPQLVADWLRSKVSFE